MGSNSYRANSRLHINVHARWGQTCMIGITITYCSRGLIYTRFRRAIHQSNWLTRNRLENYKILPDIRKYVFVYTFECNEYAMFSPSSMLCFVCIAELTDLYCSGLSPIQCPFTCRKKYEFDFRKNLRRYCGYCLWSRHGLALKKYIWF